MLDNADVLERSERLSHYLCIRKILIFRTENITKKKLFFTITKKRGKQMELPQYKVKPNTIRMVIPWIFKLLALCALFYVGIFINVKLLLKSTIPTLVNVFIVIFLLVLVIVQIVLYHLKFGKFKYVFFTNRIDYESNKPETFLFTDYKESHLKQNSLDQMFGTGTIVINNTFNLGPISNAKQVFNYLQQLIKYFENAHAQYAKFAPFHDNKSTQITANETKTDITESNSHTTTQPKQEQSMHLEQPRDKPQTISMPNKEWPGNTPAPNR